MNNSGDFCFVCIVLWDEIHYLTFSDCVCSYISSSSKYLVTGKISISFLYRVTEQSRLAGTSGAHCVYTRCSSRIA